MFIGLSLRPELLRIGKEEKKMQEIVEEIEKIAQKKKRMRRKHERASC